MSVGDRPQIARREEPEYVEHMHRGEICELWRQCAELIGGI